jgi:hypothetical protein
MPVIPTYNAPDAASVIHPSETGEQAILRSGVLGERRASVSGDMIARGLAMPAQGAADAASEVTKVVGEHKILADHSAALPGIQAASLDYQNKFNDFAKTADPDHPELYQQFHDDYFNGPAKEKYLAQFQTTEGVNYGTELWDRAAAHAQDQTTAGLAAMNGAKRVQQLSTFGQLASLRVSTDLGSLEDAQRGLVDQYNLAARQASNPQEAAHIMEELPKAQAHLDMVGFRSAAAAPNANLVALQQFVNKGGFKYADPGVLSTELKSAIRQQQAMNIQQSYVAQHEKELQQIEAANRLLAPLNQAVIEGKLITKDMMQAIVGSKDVLGSRYDHVVSTAMSLMRASVSGVYQAGDQATYGRLLGGISEGPTGQNWPTMQAFVQEFSSGHLNREQLRVLKSAYDAVLHDPGLGSAIREGDDYVRANAGFLVPGFADPNNPNISAATQDFRMFVTLGVMDAYHNGGHVAVQKFMATLPDEIQKRSLSLRALSNVTMYHPPGPGESWERLIPADKQNAGGSQNNMDEEKRRNKEIYNEIIRKYGNGTDTGSSVGTTP